MRDLSSAGGPLRPAWLIVLAWGGACATKAEAVQPLLVPQASAEEKAPARASAFEREFKSAVASYDAKNYEQARKQLEPLAARLPDDFEVNELMGLVYAGQGQDE